MIAVGSQPHPFRSANLREHGRRRGDGGGSRGDGARTDFGRGGDGAPAFTPGDSERRAGAMRRLHHQPSFGSGGRLSICP